MNSYEVNKSTIRRHIISALLTFFTGAALVLLSEIDSLTIESLKNGAFLGVLFAAIRAGVKALLELFIAWRGMKK